MKKLYDAFIELPTWQGVALIAGAVLFVAAIALVVNHIAYRRGRQDADAALLAYLDKKAREREAVRI